MRRIAFALLRASSDRPGDRPAAEKGDEIATPHPAIREPAMVRA